MTFESRIAAIEAATKRPGRFASLCESVFQTPDGQELLALLCTVANPVDHTFCADPRLSAHLSGHRELVAALWRHGAATNAVPVIHPPTTNETHGQTIE
jgi:hypothetical protein